MGLLRQIPREDWRGADGVPEVHGLGSSRAVPWVGLSCRVVSSLADNTNRWTLLLSKKSLITLRDLQDSTRRATVSWATNSMTERWPLAICWMMMTMMVVTVITMMVRCTSRWARKTSTPASTLSSTSKTSELQATKNGGKRCSICHLQGWFK